MGIERYYSIIYEKDGQRYWYRNSNWSETFSPQVLLNKDSLEIVLIEIQRYLDSRPQAWRTGDVGPHIKEYFKMLQNLEVIEIEMEEKELPAKSQTLLKIWKSGPIPI